MKHHILVTIGGPGLCGAGQGQKLFQHVRGTPLNALAGDLSKITCLRCRQRMQARLKRLSSAS